MRYLAGFVAGVLVALAVTVGAQQFYPPPGTPPPWPGLSQQRRAQQEKNELLLEQYLRDQLARPHDDPC